MTEAWYRYFTDPVLQAPTLASMLMCLSSALMGVIVLLRKRSLVGEALCHATYPGVVMSAVIASMVLSLSSDYAPFFTLSAAAITAYLGLRVVELLERRWRVKADAALCFVIASFFGVGVLIASRIQFTHSLWYKTVQIFLYGQVATMVDLHVWLYGVLALIIAIVLVGLFHPLRMLLFDPLFAASAGVRERGMDRLLSVLLVLAVVIGIRSVGVVLMSGMLIAPAVAARQLTHRLHTLFIYAGAIGAVSGFLGNYFALTIPEWVSQGGGRSFSLPTGPLIVLCSMLLCVMALLFSPYNGLLSRWARIVRFRKRCLEENILKHLWKQSVDQAVSAKSISASQRLNALQCHWVLFSLMRQGWIELEEGVRLTRDGRWRASKIVRLHRLWEAYLVFLGHRAEKVHRSAEEMEHILTPELEAQLTQILGDPHQDPHAQSIPSAREPL